MAKICNINFWIENDPPPLELFRKFIRFGRGRRPLAKDVAQSGEIQPILHEYENGCSAVSILRT